MENISLPTWTLLNFIEAGRLRSSSPRPYMATLRNSGLFQLLLDSMRTQVLTGAFVNYQGRKVKTRRLLTIYDSCTQFMA